MAHLIHSINLTTNGCCDAEFAGADEEHDAYEQVWAMSFVEVGGCCD